MHCTSPRYSYATSVPQNLAPGIYFDINEIETQEEPIKDIPEECLILLSQEVNKKTEDVKKSLKYYALTKGYLRINKQMRAVSSSNDDSKITNHIGNIFHNMDDMCFNHQVRLFRTEADDYKQNVQGKEITSRQLREGDIWQFPSFVSASITNKPNSPKIQEEGKLTVFVFEFGKNERIRGLYIGDTAGKRGEYEILLSPGVAKVKEAYKATIAMGFVIMKTKFVVVKMDFTSENSNIS
ncbi:ADP-ribosyltransferase [Criblamydia sequanensis]|uniref:ADP ribosyltransferase domain-containing protein n=1 Tax=Candidatus Criblamydia sequanensis CRIB-18 TaxID=1437425 RepID=A0A090CZY9_9BACT|nr:ADP-ribosyltransferase [Criblamydia sequanensis]CDR34606.1 hypothetical protein CSEC_1797 [Criblamydia sequanensis CRIB-18]